ncbi:MAG: hypothetical protein CM1200mP20_12850 [Pseudomonadota bacterium]|nr:MAG: hypothetical protein CM1200mP20_12850 [Pseudomonadota bacterium]
MTALSILQLIPTPPGRIVRDRSYLVKPIFCAFPRTRSDIPWSKISMVFQEPMTSLNPVLSIGRQITEQMKLHLGLDAAQARERAIELLTRSAFPSPGIAYASILTISAGA